MSPNDDWTARQARESLASDLTAPDLAERVHKKHGGKLPEARKISVRWDDDHEDWEEGNEVVYANEISQGPRPRTGKIFANKVHVIDAIYKQQVTFVDGTHARLGSLVRVRERSDQ